MNMPPPGPSPSPSPSLHARPNPQAVYVNPVGAVAGGASGYLDSPSPAPHHARGRKRKYTTTSSSSAAAVARRQSFQPPSLSYVHPHGYSHPVHNGYSGGHHHHPSDSHHYSHGGPPSSSSLAPPPPPPHGYPQGPSHHHPHHPHGQPYGMMMPPNHGHGQGPLGLNVPSTISDELPENIIDDLDRLTPRDLAVARYARNHELLSMIFDARRIDTLQPAPSPYSNMSVEQLQQRVFKFNQDLSNLNQQHTRKMLRLKDVLSGKIVTDRGILVDENQDSVVVKDQSQQQQEEEEKDWQKNPSRGRIVGLGFVRAEIPPPPPPPPQSKVIEKQSIPQQQTSQTEQEQEKQRQMEKQAIAKVNASYGITGPVTAIPETTKTTDDDDNEDVEKTNQPPSNSMTTSVSQVSSLADVSMVDVPVNTLSVVPLDSNTTAVPIL